MNKDAVDLCYFNGERMNVADARLQASDLGLLRGYGIFDYFRVVDFCPLFLEDYLARFARSAARMGLELPYGLEPLRHHIFDLIEANGLADAGVRLLLTGGYSEDGFTPTAPNLLILQYPAKTLAERYYRDGAKLISHEHVRDIPEVKTTNYAVAIRLLPEQRAAGAVDILYHQRGRLSETARSNIFVVRPDGVIVTPGRHILKGVTRKQIMGLARHAFDMVETELSLDDLKRAKELFISGSNKGLMPIVQVDALQIGDGRVGPVSRALMTAFAEHVRAYVKTQRPAST